MKIIPDDIIGHWIKEFFPSHGNFDWNNGNRFKNIKHGVTWEDVESIFYNDFVFEGRITEPEHSEKRYILLGKDSKKRTLTLIFTIRNHRLRPISCRPMRKEECERYEEKIST